MSDKASVLLGTEHRRHTSIRCLPRIRHRVEMNGNGFRTEPSWTSERDTSKNRNSCSDVGIQRDIERVLKAI